jgi:TRAP-type uncharacterized transport system substrate-binding protein
MRHPNRKRFIETRSRFSSLSYWQMTAAMVTLAIARLARADEFVNVLTGGTSGVCYPLGVAPTKIYADKIAEARTTVQSTKASVET